jgi:putative transposase
MRKIGKKPREEQSAAGQLGFPFRGLARAALWDSVVLSGLGFIEEELEAERTARCGTRYAHQEQRQAVRGGHVPSSLVLGGRRVAIERPRARSTDGHELSLPSWQTWSARDPLNQRAFEQMVVGVSTRRYSRSLEPLPEEIAVHGISKSAVSERFIVGTERRLAELMRRDLSGLKLVALLIDGVHFAEHVVLASVGVDVDGVKHPLGLREGATENAAARKALLEDLIERGLNPNRALLVVIDGAKALHRAVVDTFGERALIQRCQAHKKPNVLDALPERLRPSTRTAMNQAYSSRDPKRAQRQLENLARKLESAHPGAAASLHEGLNETLTVMSLHLSEGLERVLSSTNLIENLFSRVREIARRVKRWQGGSMILRWTAAGVLEAERHFRKVAGYRALPRLAGLLDKLPPPDSAQNSAGNQAPNQLPRAATGGE